VDVTLKIAPGVAKPLLMLAAAAAALVACGGAGSNTPAASPTPTPVSVKVGNPSKPITLTESGSSLLLPYLQKMIDPIKADYPNVTLAPAAGGSGKGISDAIAGNVVMGGSDAYLSDSQAQQNPSILNIPIAVSAQAINFNLSGVSSLKLSGDVLAQIYMGKITKWNDPAIANLNSGVTLPATAIVPVRRVDSSGDTFIFTSFLSKTNSDWSNGPSLGTTVTWPAVPGELTANGNPGMVQVCKQTPGCIAYIGVSVEATAQSAGLGEAMLKNNAGNYVTPTQDTITAGVTAQANGIPADMRASLIFGSGAQSYPIINYEYLMVKSTQPDADTALAVRSFLTWAIDPTKGATTANLSAVDFVALPSTAVEKVKAAITKITP
jgi:phosphate transport system substrate-binding protein